MKKTTFNYGGYICKNRMIEFKTNETNQYVMFALSVGQYEP